MDGIDGLIQKRAAIACFNRLDELVEEHSN